MNDILQKESEQDKHSGYYQKLYSKLKHFFKRTFSLQSFYCGLMSV